MNPPITNPTPASLSLAGCCQCGQVFHYEPLLAPGGIDLGNVFGICRACEQAREAREAAAMEERRRADNEARIRATLPEDLRATDPAHPEFRRFGAPLWQAIRPWRSNAANLTLLIHGAAGRCKTRCMALLAMAAMRANMRVGWTTAIRLKQAAADRNHRDAEIYKPAREHLGSVLGSGWLFLDDLGKQGDWTPGFESALFEVLDHRITHRLATVISSNAHPDEFHLAISSANAGPILSRLKDRATIINVGK